MKNKFYVLVLIIAILLQLVLKVNTLAGVPSPKNATALGYVYSDYLASPKMLKRSVVNEGNGDRIIAAMQKAQEGRPLILGAIGGSITYGSSAMSSSTYTYLVTKWWRSKFPKSAVKFINSGVSGTGSLIGVHRAQNDLLNRNPDFIIMDFAVNDTDSPVCDAAYESLIRNILGCPSNPGLMLLFMSTDSGYNLQANEVKAGRKYNLPMISYRDAVMPDIKNRDLSWRSVAADFIHPNDKGHHITADLIISYLERLYKQINKKVTIATKLPQSLNKDLFTSADYLNNKTLQIKELGGWEATDHAHWQLKEGWKPIKINKPMVFEVTARKIFLVYNKTINNKGSTIKVTVDNNKPLKFQSKSTNTWEEITADKIEAGSHASKHTISIEFTDEIPIGCTGEEFNLLGVMVSQ